ncbi:8254_t:CDS:2 [Funneliformis geosporum]|nr:8254_t:CDS:2 [Funneliformis geosporum]
MEEMKLVELLEQDESEKNLITTEETCFDEAIKQDESEKDLIRMEASLFYEPFEQNESEENLYISEATIVDELPEHDEPKKDLFTTEATIVYETLEQSESDKDLISTEAATFDEQIKQPESEKELIQMEATTVIELQKPNEFENEMQADASQNPREESISYPLIVSPKEDKMERLEKETTKIAERVNASDKVKALKSQLHLLFNHKMSESAAPKENSDQYKIDNQVVVKPDKPVSKSSENGVKKEPGKAIHVGNTFCEKRTIKADQALQLSPTKDKLERGLPATLNVKLCQTYTISQKSKLPNSVPTYILVGDRFVREDKALIDLDKDDSVETSSINNIKPVQVKLLPPELQEIDYTGWIMQQIVKPSGSFLEEFEAQIISSNNYVTRQNM